jgi:hypothetical protein
MNSIKHEELRIGNIINILTDVEEVDNIQLSFGGYYTVNGFNVADCSGVTINHDWLSKFGFVRSSVSEYTYGQRSEFNIPVMCIDVIGHMLLDSKYGKKLVYLHELQNFFYAISGKELELQS